MSRENSIIDQKRLDLLLKFSNSKESKKLGKRVRTLFRGFTAETLKLVDLLDRFNDPGFSSDNFENYQIGNRKLIIIRKESQIKKAINDIVTEDFIGFDTEQKPTFKRGESQKDISIVQMATKNNCYIFQMKFIKDKNPIIDIISNKNIIKVGFDLKNDYKELNKQFGIQPQNIFDLSPFIKTRFLHKHQIGVKSAVALFLQEKMQKSKKVVLTNWENNNLTDSQVKYASEDATAPYDVYDFVRINFPHILEYTP